MRIISWNVLYRDYETKYNPTSKILTVSEEERVCKIIELLKPQVESTTVICLQEVSSKVMMALFHAFEATHTIFSHNIREDEHLVTVTPKEYKLCFATVEEQQRTENHTSNGFLTVSNDRYIIVNCHLIPQRYAKVNVLEHLLSFTTSRKGNKTVFIAGDFNERQKIVKMTLGDHFTCPSYGRTYKKKPIDHIIFTKNIVNYTAGHILQNLISDHHAIKLDFEE